MVKAMTPKQVFEFLACFKDILDAIVAAPIIEGKLGLNTPLAARQSAIDRLLYEFDKGTLTISDIYEREFLYFSLIFVYRSALKILDEQSAAVLAENGVTVTELQEIIDGLRSEMEALISHCRQRSERLELEESRKVGENEQKKFSEWQKRALLTREKLANLAKLIGAQLGKLSLSDHNKEERASQWLESFYQRYPDDRTLEEKLSSEPLLEPALYGSSLEDLPLTILNWVIETYPNGDAERLRSAEADSLWYISFTIQSEYEMVLKSISAFELLVEKFELSKGLLATLNTFGAAQNYLFSQMSSSQLKEKSTYVC